MDDQNERFIVVDENDNILGYRTRYDCHHDPSLIHRGVSVAVFNEKGELLLQKRSKHKDSYPGLYTFSASGHVTKGQEYEEAAKRELFEELGVEADVTFVSKRVSRTDFDTEMDVLFTAHHNGPFKINPQEVEEVEFFSQEDIAKMVNKLTPRAQETLKILNLL